MANPPLYQVVDWNLHFENAKSRTYDRCQYVVSPNKHGGSGWSNVMGDENGAAIWGIWKMILDVCSRQRRPREGWLTADGKKEGRRLTDRELSNLFRRPLDEVQRALEVLSSNEVAFMSIADGQPEDTRRIPDGYHEDTREVSEYPSTIRQATDTAVSVEYPQPISASDTESKKVTKKHSLSKGTEEDEYQTDTSRIPDGYQTDTPRIPDGHQTIPDGNAEVLPISEVEVVQHAEAKRILGALAKEVFPDEAPGAIWDNKLEHDLDEMLPLKRSVLEKVAWAYRLPAAHRLFQDKGGGGMMRRRSFASLIPNLKSEASKITDARKKIGLNGLKSQDGGRKTEDGGEWTPVRREAAVNLYGAADLPERFSMMPASCQAEIEKKIKERVA